MGGGYPLSLQKSIAIIPKFGGALSLIACTFIMRDVIIKWHRKKSVSLSSVLIFCISVSDWLYSFFSAFMSTWMIPKHTGYFLASGNTQSCTAQGFITTFTIGASISFYTALMILFCLMVRSSWSETFMSSLRLRSFFIVPPIAISLGIALPPLFLEMYNHGGLSTCFVAPYPIDCEENSEVDCIRGGGAWKYWDAFILYVIICNLVIVSVVCLLISTVLKQERKTDKYLIKGQEKRRENTTKVAWQGLRYIGAYMLAYFNAYIFYAYHRADAVAPVHVVYLHLILMPLLGLFNSIAYFRPRYLIYRQMNPDETLIVCLGKVFNVELDYYRKSIMGNTSDESIKDESILGVGNSSDLTSPLFQDNRDSREDSGVV